MTRVVLLYSPSASPAVRAALVARGWAVQLVSSLAEGKAALGGAAVDLVILDDPSWAQAKEMIAMLDAGPKPVPRLWVSSLPEAPAHSGRLGVDALLLDPSDVDGIAAQAERFIEPRMARASTTPLFAAGSSPAVRTVPRAARGSGEWDDESTGEWP